MNLQQQTALSLGGLLRERQLGCVELTRHLLDRIRHRQPQINAYTLVQEQQALARAADVQALLDAGEALSPLAGVPMALKDNLCMAGVPTTCSSRMLREYIPPYSATAVEKLEAAGAVVLGRLNMDEFGMGGSTASSCFGPTRNPWDLCRAPGGSSGGGAAAVADGQVLYALGSDTGGSIRQPCAFCGVSGIRPTWGAVSRYGLVALAPSMDTIGPMGRTIADCAAVLQLLLGRDPRDSTSIAREIDCSAGLFSGLSGLRIGIPRGCFDSGLDPDVAAPVLAAAKTIESLGAAVQEFDFAMHPYTAPTYAALCCAEASSSLARFGSVCAGALGEQEQTPPAEQRTQLFGPEVHRRLLLGTWLLQKEQYHRYYRQALCARRLICGAFEDAFCRFDLLLTPAAPTVATPLEGALSAARTALPGDRYTTPASLAGLPAAALPCGFGRGGLPVGLQLIGPAFSEPLLVQAAHAFQRATDFHLSRPGGEKGGGGPA